MRCRKHARRQRLIAQLGDERCQQVGIALEKARWYWVAGALLIRQLADNSGNVFDVKCLERRRPATRRCGGE